MAARLNNRHQDMVREKIRASQLVNRLENHVFGEVDLNSSQVTAALGLLKKCVPDLKSSDDTLTVEGEIGVRQVVKEYADSKGNIREDI